jgi:lysozyme
VAKKTKKPAISYWLLIFIPILLGSLGAGAWYWYNKPRFVRYAGFGISLPVHYRIHGIDVSRYQGAIDWQEVKAMNISGIKIGFCFIKATEGVNDTDRRFGRNWRWSKKVGMPRGAYHFFNPYRSGTEQAQNFIQTVKLEPGDLPPVLDVEQAGSVSKSQLQQRVADWLKKIENHYGVKPVIYSGADFYEQYLAECCADYPFWIAHYLVKEKPRASRNWQFWQHNETGKVNGIDASVDFNVFNGDSSAFKKLLIQ